jgi:hypothetical protein
VEQPVEQEQSIEQSMDQEQPTGQSTEQPMEQTMEQEPPTEQSTEQPPTSRIRKVRIATDPPAPPQQSPHLFYTSRLAEHRAAERTAKNERYSNLRLY